jgi:hypothetical protein
MGENRSFSSTVGFWILVVVAVYLVYALYFAVYGLTFSIDLISNTYVYSLVTKNSWWWQILYYGSEGVAGSVAIVLRAIAACFAFYSAFLYWRRGNEAFPLIKQKAGTALMLEAGFFLALIPSIIAAFAYNSTTEYLFYFDHTPELILLYGTAVPCLAIVLVVPPLLLKLRATILRGGQKQEIAKWISLTGVGYLFVVFWFNYSMLWMANLVPYPRAQQQYGLDFLLQPVNLVSFIATFVGLLVIAISALVIALPTIKKNPKELNYAGLGAVMTAFGGYFIFNTLFYYLTGGYEAHPSVWYEVIGPLHNPNLWCIGFFLLGLVILVHLKKRT